MSFALYIWSLVVLVAGIAWGLVIAGVATIFIAIWCLLVAGIGIMATAGNSRRATDRRQQHREQYARHSSIWSA